MANIRVDLNHAPLDGEAVTFKAPCDASEITGLVIYYDGVSKAFTLTDANGNDIGVLDNIFAEGAIVKAILDTDGNKAFVQNPNTNTYLENELAKKYSPTNKPTAADVDAAPATAYTRLTILKPGWYRVCSFNPTSYGSSGCVRIIISGVYNGIYAVPHVVEITSDDWGAILTKITDSGEVTQISKVRSYLADGVRYVDVYYNMDTYNHVNIGVQTVAGAVTMCALEDVTDVAVPTYTNICDLSEWRNPPMVAGVEYRTMERYNDEPVYRKLVILGWVGAGDNTFEHGISGIWIPIEIQMQNTWSGGASVLTTSDVVEKLSFDWTNIYAKTTVNNGNLRVLLWYTKG